MFLFIFIRHIFFISQLTCYLGFSIRLPDLSIKNCGSLVLARVHEHLDSLLHPGREDAAAVAEQTLMATRLTTVNKDVVISKSFCFCTMSIP